MLRKLLCWHAWGRWAYSRTKSDAKRRHMVRRTCAKCGTRQYRRERPWFG